jgi:3-isopropylmalate dehydrogenase
VKTEFEIAVLAGDGIGPEIMQPCLTVLDAAVHNVGGFSLRYVPLPAGIQAYLDFRTALPESTLEQCKNADAILLAAMGLPDIRYPDGTEIVPQIELREKLDLYAGVRPVRSIQGAPMPLADPRGQNLDVVIIRESTEGLFKARVNGVVENDQIARDTMEITRHTSERLFNFAFAYTRKRKAKGRPGILTCVDKANVLPSMVFFRKIFDECASANTDITANRAYVDAVALNMVRSPWIYDVMVMENMYGDILSDLGAGLIGGMGMAPSADIGDDYAVFQPCHGSAPDIAGMGKANPTAMFLSAAMMLDWLGDVHGNHLCQQVAHTIVAAVDAAFSKNHLITCEFGGESGTEEITQAVLQQVD